MFQLFRIKNREISTVRNSCTSVPQFSQKEKATMKNISAIAFSFSVLFLLLLGDFGNSQQIGSPSSAPPGITTKASPSVNVCKRCKGTWRFGSKYVTLQPNAFQTVSVNCSTTGMVTGCSCWCGKGNVVGSWTYRSPFSLTAPHNVCICGCRAKGNVPVPSWIYAQAYCRF